jgi:Trk K+ transport system NAD-binding subunit/nucleotide-binding universal stress UspA family protein
MKIATSEIEPRVLIVGAGTTGRELLNRLVVTWHVSIVDIDEAKLSMIGDEVDPDRIRKTVGDGTSRLVLERAGIDHVDYVAAITGSDRTNLEVCRIAREDYEKSNLFASVVKFNQRESYREANVDFVSPSSAAALNLETRILHGVGTSLNTGEGRGEVIEITVLSSSPMIGRTLSSVRSRRWHVGAVYRSGKLIVPTGPTRIEQDDRVILIGEPEILRSIGEFFRIGEPEFPLEFGSNVHVMTESSTDFEHIAGELRYLLDHSHARSVEVLYWPHEPGIQPALERALEDHQIEASTLAVFGEYGDVAAKHVVTKDCGCLIVPDARFRFLERIGLRRTALAEIFKQMDSPVAVLRGSNPYRRILLPVTEADASMRTARLAFDLARIYDASVTIVTVTAPRFVVGLRAVEDQKAALRKVNHLANLYHVEVERIHLEGNPIEEVLKLCPDYQLMVLSHGKDRRPSFFNPDASQHLVRRSSITTVVLPV